MLTEYHVVTGGVDSFVDAENHRQAATVAIINASSLTGLGELTMVEHLIPDGDTLYFDTRHLVKVRKRKPVAELLNNWRIK